MDGQSVPGRVVFKHRDKLVASHRAIWVSPLVLVARQNRQSARDIEVKGIPALRAPRLAYSAAFKDDVWNACDAQPLAYAETGPPGTNHHHVQFAVHYDAPRFGNLFYQLVALGDTQMRTASGRERRQLMTTFGSCRCWPLTPDDAYVWPIVVSESVTYLAAD